MNDMKQKVGKQPVNDPIWKGTKSKKPEPRIKESRTDSPAEQTGTGGASQSGKK